MNRVIGRLHREERGFALIWAMTTMFIVLTLSIVAINLAIHNSTASAQDRARTQAVNAAEAGIDVVYSQMGRTGFASLPCTQDSDLTTSPVEHFHVVVQYFATYPPTGNALTCPLTQNPVGAVITSTGTAPGASPTAPATRIMQSEVRMSPITLGGSFVGAMYGQNGVSMGNTVTVNGHVGNDGDVYTGGQWQCQNTGTVYGNVYAASVNQTGTCTVAGDVWANGAVSANGLVAGHDVISSTSSIGLSGQSSVTHNATSGTTCSGCTTRVAGTVTTNHVSSAPPLPTFPTINYTQSDWTSQGYTIKNYSDCTAAGNFLQDVGSATPYVVRITPACNLSYNNKVTITVRANLAVITDGSINMSNKVNIVSADGAVHTLYFIVPSNSNPNCGNGTMSFTNGTVDSTIRLFIYTPCSVSWTNGTGLDGQIFGGSVNVTNSFSMTYLPLDVPGYTTTTGYQVDIAYIREVSS